MTAKPHRRWSFSLEALLIVVLLSITLGWLGFQINWMRQRQQSIWGRSGIFRRSGENAPFPLMLFGAEGFYKIVLFGEPTNSPTVQWFRRLFPEAMVHGLEDEDAHSPAIPTDSASSPSSQTDQSSD